MDAEVMTVNMHRLGESFVEKVIDVRRRVTVDGKVTAPGESLEFLALIQGWQSEARRERRERLLKLNDIEGSIGTCDGKGRFLYPRSALC